MTKKKKTALFFMACAFFMLSAVLVSTNTQLQEYKKSADTASAYQEEIQKLQEELAAFYAKTADSSMQVNAAAKNAAQNFLQQYYNIAPVAQPTAERARACKPYITDGLYKAIKPLPNSAKEDNTDLKYTSSLSTVKIYTGKVGEQSAEFAAEAQVTVKINGQTRKSRQWIHLRLIAEPKRGWLVNSFDTCTMEEQHD